MIAAVALVAGLRSSIKGAENAAFIPVAVYGAVLGYLLGLRHLPARRAWIVIVISGLIVIFLEAARLPGPLVEMARSIPQIQLDFWKSVFARETPDLSPLFTVLNTAWVRATGFISTLFAGRPSTLRECLWDIPLLLLSAWSGWRLASKGDALTALIPALALQGTVLDYTSGETISLQVAAFCMLLLLGLNQKWSLNQAQRPGAVRDTYTTIAVLTFALAITAGMLPALSVRAVAQAFTDEDTFSETLGLKLDAVQQYSVSASGLPLQHLIGTNPSTLQAVVFRVDTGERLELFDEGVADEADVPRHYWRSVTYDAYNGREWTSSFADGLSYDANERLMTLPAQGYQIVHQEVEKASASNDRLYWTGSLARVDKPFEASWRTEPSSFRDPLLTADMLGALTNRQSYSADSIIPILSETQLRSSSTTYPTEIGERYLALPEVVSPRVRQLANELTLGIKNPYDKARAIESYLRTFPYELDVPPPPEGSEIADYFLFELKTGYCDYYATSMIVLARAAGLPARLVIGYSTGEYDRASGAYVVRELHAPSWVEVYFAGIGWVEFEPTASRPLITWPAELSQEQNYSPSPSAHRAEAMSKRGFFPKRSYAPALIGLGSILSFLSIWFLREGGLIRSHDSIASIYAYVYLHGKKIYRDAPTSETPSVFAHKLKRRLHGGYRILRPAGAELEMLTDLYMRETYSAHPISEDERRGAVQIWRKLFWRLLYAQVVKA